MSRMAREKSCTGLYHVMLRGADRRTIFSDDEDNQRFLEIVQRVKRESLFQLFAYCLMGNHVHLLLRKRDTALRKALGTGVSIRQLSRLTGISKAIIERTAKM